MAAGFRLHQAGEAEAILLFDPVNKEQVALAIALIRAKRLRCPVEPTAAQCRARALFSQRVRPSMGVTGARSDAAAEQVP